MNKNIWLQENMEMKRQLHTYSDHFDLLSIHDTAFLVLHSTL